MIFLLISQGRLASYCVRGVLADPLILGRVREGSQVPRCWCRKLRPACHLSLVRFMISTLVITGQRQLDQFTVGGPNKLKLKVENTFSTPLTPVLNRSDQVLERLVNSLTFAIQFPPSVSASTTLQDIMSLRVSCRATCPNQTSLCHDLQLYSRRRRRGQQVTIEMYKL